VLNNLKAIYAGRQDWARLLRTSAQILVVTPDESSEHFTQGVAWAGLGRRDVAIRAFEHYLTVRPDAPNRDDVLDLLSQLRLKR
jgi:regulator of sirC expression with transglutaminase-like and TPR domain